jgi:hypothetical protein
MPHYYFDIKGLLRYQRRPEAVGHQAGHGLVDPSGLNFKDDDNAIAKAEVIAIDAH